MNKSTNSPTSYLSKLLAIALVAFLLIFFSFSASAQKVDLSQYNKNTHNWQNGNLGGVYVEGETVPYKSVITGLPSGGSTGNKFVFNFDRTGTGSSPITHGIDYLNFYNATVETEVLPLANTDNITIIGGSNITVSAFSEGDVPKSKTHITVTFDATGSEVTLLWGGHLAATDNSIPYYGAGEISGAPYHMRLENFNNKSLGNLDRSVKVGQSCQPLSADLTKCANETFNLNDAYAGSDVITWYNSNNDLINDPLQYAGADGEQVFAMNSNNCDVLYVTLHLNPLPAVTVNSPTTCPGTGTTVAATPGTSGTYAYAWTVPTGVTAPGNVASFTTTTAGTYTVIITNTTTTCVSASASGTVTVNPLPTATVAATTPICSGTTATFTISGTTDDVVTYSITGGSSNPYPTVIIGAGGTATVTVSNATINQVVTLMSVTRPSTACSQTQSGTATVTVNPLPVPHILSGPSSVCPTTKGNIYTTESGMNDYQWNVTGGAITNGSNTSSITVTWGNAGTGHVSVNYALPVTGCTAATAADMSVNINCGVYTYTQGFYGSTTGKACLPADTKIKFATLTTPATAVNILTSFLFNNNGLTIGNNAPLVGLTIGNTPADATALNKKLPGGSTPNKLGGAYTLPTVPTNNGRISNVLLSQTITLAVNNGINNNLFAIILDPSKYLTSLKLGGSCTLPTCGAVGSTIISQKISGISTAMYNWLLNSPNGRSINELYILANNALGALSMPTGITYSDITAAIDFVNKSFDGGATFLGNFGAPQISCPLAGARTDGSYVTTLSTNSPAVSINPKTEIANALKFAATAYPNPFTDKVQFNLESNVSGRGVLEVYNMNGQKIQTVYDGNVFAGKSKMIQYSVPVQNRTALTYRFTVNGQTVSGKLINVR